MSGAQFTAAMSYGPKEVKAVLTDNLAVHRSLGKLHPILGEGGWTLSHRPSGAALALFTSKRKALDVAAILERDHADDLNAVASIGFGKQITRRSNYRAAGKRLGDAIDKARGDQ